MTTAGIQPNYGFGIFLSGQGPTRAFGHAGGAPGQNGDLRIYRDSGYVVVVLSNLDPPAASAIADYIAARLPLTTKAPQPAVTVVDDFESGSLSGWALDRRGDGNWFTYQDGRQPPDPKQSNMFMPFNMPGPPQGKFAAVSDGVGPGSKWMHREIKLDGSRLLELTVFYINGTDGLSGYSSPFAAPNTLAINAGPNQQFRVDILAPTAAADSMAGGDVRATVFATGPDAPARRGPISVQYDLTPWAGQTVRLRIATANNQSPLRAGVDNVRLLPIER